ncbi:hypothetical protein WDW37_10370 [Bdellovibrionota bacterium FG-1]
MIRYALLLALSSSALATAAFANDPLIRWTATEDTDGSISHVLDVLGKKLGYGLTRDNFTLQEERDLAFNHYRYFVQLADGVPVHGKGIRIWTELNPEGKTERTVQIEADLNSPRAIQSLTSRLRDQGSTAAVFRQDLSSEETLQLTRKSVLTDLDDPNLRGISWKDEWKNGQLERLVKVHGKRGVHWVHIDLDSQEVTSREYREFPQDDVEIPVQIYPVYEENESDHQMLSRVPGVLRHILPQVPQNQSDLYAPLKTQRYYDYKYNPTLGQTEAGRAQGFWSMAYVKGEAARIRAALPLVDNSFANGLLLQGRYTSINIHPDAITQYGPLGFSPVFSTPFLPNWVQASGDPQANDEMIPMQAYAGKPLSSAQDAMDRPARRLPNHNPTAYLNDGFDEIQVYYAVDTLFNELHARGWKDPELSTRPFNAFLFNPDISMRDNAYYTDDTINFTTYSPTAINFARDNSTIWHELGHGVMDRLMGDNIELADTGGLSEGMADFVAALVVQAVTQGKPFAGSNEFRIINKTGFNLTNEVHDDGEAYGGAMKDFLDAALQANPKTGLEQVTDVELEAMRLTRDYPGLTAAEWFNHILFADSLGRPGLRAPNALKPFLTAALAGRNFKFDTSPVATFGLVNTTSGTPAEVVAGSPGSRNSPIPVVIDKAKTASFTLQASVKNSDSFAFKFPVQVKVKFNAGPLEGAIHWVGEEKGDQVFTLSSETDVATIPLTVTGTCDEVNRQDGSCVDYAYVQIWGAGDTTRPTAKKRFYLRVKNP